MCQISKLRGHSGHCISLTMAEQSQLSVFLLKMHFLAKFANRASATLYYYYHVSEKNARLVSLCIY